MLIKILQNKQIELPNLQKIKSKLIKEKKIQGPKIDTNLKGKRIKHKNELEFNKRSQNSIFGSKNKLSHQSIKEIKRKLDKDISNIVDYSIKYREQISLQSSPTNSPSKGSPKRQIFKISQEVDRNFLLTNRFVLNSISTGMSEVTLINL